MKENDSASKQGSKDFGDYKTNLYASLCLQEKLKQADGQNHEPEKSLYEIKNI